MSRRVVITGLGAVTPVGNSVAASWQTAITGRSGIDKITRFDTTGFATQIAGEVKGFEPEKYIDKKEIKKMDLFIQYALAAGQEAVDDAGLVISEQEADRVGVFVGAGLGGLATLERYHSAILEGGPRKVSPFFIPMLIANMAPGQLAIRFGAKGPNLSSVSACAAANHALGDAFKVIQRGDADVMISGGTESVVTPLGIAGFNAMKALSLRNDAPQAASRPFERDRDGFVLSEGSGIIILEELERARGRGAKIYAELVGYGLNADAYHMTAPSPGGEGAARCLKMALTDARVDVSQVGYINAHGTSTPLNDVAETQAIKIVFGDYAKRLLVSSTKSVTGHLLGAAGGVEAIFTVKAVETGIIPPTINYDNPDPECDLDYVANTAREVQVDVAISNAFGFGGTNACLVFKRWS